MKTIGKKTILLQLAILAICIAIMAFITGYTIILIIPIAVLVSRLLRSPIIRISNDSFSVSTLLPLFGNVQVPFSSIKKIAVDAGYNMRFVVETNDGSEKTITTTGYTENIAPLYNALEEKGVTVEKTGRGA